MQSATTQRGNWTPNTIPYLIKGSDIPVGKLGLFAFWTNFGKYPIQKKVINNQSKTVAESKRCSLVKPFFFRMLCNLKQTSILIFF